MVANEITFQKADHKLLLEYTGNYEKIINFVDKQNINEYVNFTIERLFAANKYFNDQEPWKKKSDPTRLNTIIYTSLELIRKASILLYPIIPDTSLKVMKIFDYDIKNILFDTLKNNLYIKKGSRINKIDILFKKINKND